MSAHKEIVLKGIGVSPGVVVGTAFLLNTPDLRHIERTVDDEEVPREIARFEEALIATRSQLRDIQQRLERALDQKNASIFDAHLLVCDDRSFVEEVIRGVSSTRRNVEPVLAEVAERYASALAKVEDDYLRERASDVRDVARRIQMNLAGRDPGSLNSLKEPCIVVASDLAPSDTASMDRRLVTGFVTDLGSATSHTAIMARALEIPSVVALHDAGIRISHGDRILVDGQEGIVVVHPSEERLEGYGRIQIQRETVQAQLQGLRDEPACTLDGYDLHLAANIERPQDVDSALRYGAQGIGLFRTEFMFLQRAQLPDEMEQARAYEEVARRMAPAPVIIRTLDIGGDKFTSVLKMPRELNPFLGCRAIRFCLSQPELFRVQLRAILRASAVGNVKLMYPMISNTDEIIRANRILDHARRELAHEGAAFDEQMEVGCMIEVPSAALTAHLLARKVKFFSIGSNDLIQYTMAVDRVNENLTHLYEPTHPAILRLVRMTIDAARDAGIWTGVCGEMAGHPALVPLLLGLGVNELSVSPSLVPVVKGVVRALRYPQAEALAQEALAGETAADVLERCESLTRSIAPDILRYAR